MNSKRKWTDDQFISAVSSSKSYAEVIKKLGLKPAGSNYETVKSKIKELNLNTSHMTGQGWNVKLKFVPNTAQPLSEILVKNSTFKSTFNLKNRLLKEGLKEHKCEICKQTEWLGKPIPLELHHINNVKNDLRIENLQILCPNCHAQTDNYRGKQKGKSAQKETSDVEVG